MAAYHYCRRDPGRLPGERVMAADFWPDSELEIEQLIAEVRASRGGVITPAVTDPCADGNVPPEDDE